MNLALKYISIHSPYTGRDGFRTARGEPVQSISIHSPYTGRDAYRSGKGIEQLVFQSTLPIQGETLNRSRSAMRNIFQSTLPIQGETRGSHRRYRDINISIHSPYTGRDCLSPASFIPFQSKFQSTLPIQGETMIN